MTDVYEFPDIEWSDTTTRRVKITPVLAVAGVIGVVGLFGYHRFVVGSGEPLFGYDVGRIDWLWLISLWLFVAYVVVPAVRDPEATAAFVGRFRHRPVGAVAGVVTGAVFLLGTVGPLVVPQPTPQFTATNQPPVLTSLPSEVAYQCLNRVGDRCLGTWGHPLGTTASGKDVLLLLVVGTRQVVKLSMVAVMLIIPVATLVGTVAAYVGGTVDRLLTGAAGTIETIPAILVFLAWRWVNAIGGNGNATLFMLVVSFGLFSWGSVANVVRSRALTEVQKNYVTAAKANGASTAQVVGWHLIPNVARTAFSITVYQVPLFVTIAATLQFLKFNESSLLLTPTSQEGWGKMIGDNVTALDPYWWRPVMPAVALVVTILSLYLFANTLQDVLDPRTG